MNKEQTITMGTRVGLSTQPFEKKEIFYEKIASLLSGKQDLLDRLNTFTAENVGVIIEQLQTMLKALYRLPSETRQEGISSYGTIIGGLQNTVVELTLALDQLVPPENEASFCEHLRLSQMYFADVFAHDLSASERVHVHTNPAPATLFTFPSKSTSLLDFSSMILPDLYALIQKPGLISSTQYEQAIVQLQTLDELLEKQKSMLKVSHSFYNDNSAILHSQLRVILAYASELLRRLIYSLLTLQTQSHSKSRRTAQLREDTCTSLTVFIHNLDDIVLKNQEMKLLKYQGRF